ncbi:bifunctional dihydropteridine reductase/dihydrofolate reductase TmpR [Thermus tenuipuniceus]|uniref:bifunctional dihydropteridine reductase/dihydrofolate reductase TmpR n=1 Tax=Thermus tenuipuniceus TaxID=2078690 RepID=UPI000CF9893B|nr:bifunctional dihydropteridine reductase/dihydrofolate reductase TmpR [Thermus tenuipuniceus]
MRVALVTGSAKGIGRAILLALAKEGFHVAVHYRTSEGLAEATRLEAEASGVKAIKVRADLTREEEVLALVEEVRYHLGGIGVLVNNVGDYLYKPIEEVSLEEWRWILDSNLTSTFLLTQRVLPLMVAQGYGRIVNLGYAGAHNLLSRPHITPYAIAKTGVILYTKAIAKRFAGAGITANVVAPGVAENSISQPLQEIPMARLALLEEIARAVLFFVREPYVTGQVLEVAGGWNL